MATGDAMRGWMWLGVVLAVGCTRVWREYEFVEEYPQRMCDRATACAWVDDYETCVDDRLAAIEEDQLQCADYDSSSVQGCFDEIKGLGCDALEYDDPDLHPFACRYVFDCTLNPL